MEMKRKRGEEERKKRSLNKCVKNRDSDNNKDSVHGKREGRGLGIGRLLMKMGYSRGVLGALGVEVDVVLLLCILCW